MLKYDQTGEALQTTATADACTEPGCSVLTPEQIYSQLSKVLHSGGPENGPGNTDSHGRKRERGRSCNVGEKEVARKLGEGKTGKLVKRTRERKGRQPKRAKEAQVARTLVEKRTPRHRLRARKGSKPLPVENSSDKESNSSPMALSTTKPVHVVEVSPETTDSGQDGVAILTNSHSPSRIAATHGVITPSVDKTPPSNHLSAKKDETGTLESSAKSPTPSFSSNTGAAVSHESALSTATVARLSGCHGSPCQPLNYELLGRLIGEPVLMSFYLSFLSSRHSEHLRIELLDPLGGESSSLQHEESDIVPRWLQITPKHMHIDPHLGPLTLARILVSNIGIVKFQHLFPFIRTVYMRYVKSCNLEAILSELSPRHVLCPGLLHYPRYHVALGYHPEDVRIRHVQTPDYQRYDHRKCPILHVPRRMSSPSTDDKSSENMCSKCAQLHTSILKLICNKLSCANHEKLPSCFETSQESFNPSHPANNSTPGNVVS